MEHAIQALTDLLTAKDQNPLLHTMLNIVLLLILLSPCSFLVLLLYINQLITLDVIPLIILISIGNAVFFFILYLLVSIRYVHINSKEDRKHTTNIFEIDSSITVESNVLAVLIIEAVIAFSLLLIYLLQSSLFTYISNYSFLIICIALPLLLNYFIKWVYFISKLIVTSILFKIHKL